MWMVPDEERRAQRRGLRQEHGHAAPHARSLVEAGLKQCCQSTDYHLEDLEQILRTKFEVESERKTYIRLAHIVVIVYLPGPVPPSLSNVFKGSINLAKHAMVIVTCDLQIYFLGSTVIP